MSAKMAVNEISLFKQCLINILLVCISLSIIVTSFFSCEFVLQQKGPDYVHRIVVRFPDIRRPGMLNQITGTPQQHNYDSIIPR